jgi:ADP-ribose pyrophosphatase YjhB (NUDIX family)
MNYEYCPKCGASLKTRDEHGVDRLTCSVCGFVFYQNSKPTATALVLDGDKVLLAKRAGEPFKGMWDTPGGFLENGEHPEDGARRELLEETGLTIELQGFLGIFMDTYGENGDATLNICYTAKKISGEEAPQDDVAELRWFPIADTPEKMAFKNGDEMLRALRDKLNV